MSDTLDPTVKPYRQPEHPIHPLFVNRWSPRAMTGEALEDQEIFSLFEAARWAPSSYNGQPWRFLWAKKGSKEWEVYFNVLLEGNQSWAKEASVLILILSRRHFESNQKPERTHSFDAGAAWMSLALQATAQGLTTRGMQGFNYEKARRDLKVSDEYTIEAMVAVGKQADKTLLPDTLAKKEIPSSRHSIDHFSSEGLFNSNWN